MKLYGLKIMILSCLLGVATSCTDFLDTEPDYMDTIEQVFQRRSGVEEYLANIYKYIRTEVAWSNESPWTGISDELDITYQDYAITKVNIGAMDSKSNYFNYWSHYYKGIRSASYFILHVEDNQEMEPELKAKYKAEARYLRAWFYFCLFRQYGPVVIVPDATLPPDATNEEMAIARSTVSETVNYIENELIATINMGVLPKTPQEQLKDFKTSEMGRITEGACRAALARLLLYAASDFYNKDMNPAYADMKNKDGKLLFDYTNTGKKERWEKAAKASKEVLDMGFSLYKEYDGAVLNAYNSCKNLFLKDWNVEVIHAKPRGGFTEMDQACSPRFIGSNAWSGWGATQQIVDAFFMSDGTSPFQNKDGYTITDVNGIPLQTPGSIYSETGYTSDAGDNGQTIRDTYRMYTNREPRFYVNITFNNCKWIASTNNGIVDFKAGGSSGWNAQTNGRNFSRTGYLCKKFVNPASNPQTSTYPNHHQIYFRAGEFYLNAAESLNEAGYENKEEVLFYLNAIRERAGIPLYGTNAGQLSIPVDQQEMRNAIRNERRVELAFETHRYFDCKRWIISEITDGGPFFGMDVYSMTSEGFHKRTIFETRSFTKRNYLWPIYLDETYKDGLLVQNKGW